MIKEGPEELEEVEAVPTASLPDAPRHLQTPAAAPGRGVTP